MSLPVVVGITGASGARFAQRLVELLLQLDRAVMLSMSAAGAAVLRHELRTQVDLTEATIAALFPWGRAGQLRFFQSTDLLAPIASGSFRTSGMVICPCSGGTLSAVAHGADQNLIHRAANVHLKERRPLVLVPRETPLSLPMI